MAHLSKKKVAWLSVLSNAFLTAGKLVVGLVSGSMSILSEAVHSAVDLLAAGIATFAVYVSDRPPDGGHPYGHEKIENISGVIEGLLILAAAIWIIVESLEKLITGSELKVVGLGLIIMAVSAGMNIVVATLLRRTALAERSIALEADAAHLSADVYTSIGVFAGLVSILIGREFFYVDLIWLDSAIAMAVAVLILFTGVGITLKSFQPLMDSAASPEEMGHIDEIMKGFFSRGVDFHKIRSRRAGPSLYIDAHMHFAPGTSLEVGHQMSHEFQSAVEAALPYAKLLVHIEPCFRLCDDCRAECPERCEGSREPNPGN